MHFSAHKGWSEAEGFPTSPHTILLSRPSCANARPTLQPLLSATDHPYTPISRHSRAFHSCCLKDQQNQIQSLPMSQGTWKHMVCYSAQPLLPSAIMLWRTATASACPAPPLSTPTPCSHPCTPPPTQHNPTCQRASLQVTPWLRKHARALCAIVACMRLTHPTRAAPRPRASTLLAATACAPPR
jgi:hypothetical protein